MSVRLVAPDSFQVERHYYPRVPNARLHPLVRYFLGLGNRRIATRYCHLHPEVAVDAVHAALDRTCRYFRWAGADLFHVATSRGVRHNVVIEVNSSPSGMKSMPLIDDDDDLGGYRKLLERSFLPLLRRRALPKGRLAVLWDKNEMETTGYAAAMAELTGEDVLLVHCPADASEHIRWRDGVLFVDMNGEEVPIRAAFRYVTQRPWTRIPPITRTAMLNPVVVCLAGGRNKLLAAKAYDFYNGQLAPTGLAIRTPETIWDVSINEVPLWVARMGGVAVVKDPYSNAGQGVFTITSPEELEAFMTRKHRYDQFIVQALIGNSAWSSKTKDGCFYHVGTTPNRRGEIYVADLRFMLGNGPGGFYPIALYARRARAPLSQSLTAGQSSWDMLGTNLSVKNADGSFSTEPDRLMLMDSRDFNHLGVGLDDLTEAYIQTALSVTAIDEMASQLITKKSAFRRRFFANLVPDPTLSAELMT
jgi:hypothetical protein